jgi:hypothetical protein
MIHIARENILELFEAAEIDHLDHINDYLRQFAKNKIYNVYLLRRYFLAKDSQQKLELLKTHEEDMKHLIFKHADRFNKS